MRTASLSEAAAQRQGRGEVSEGGPGADELSYIATGKRAAPPEPPFPRALSRRRARCLRRTQGRTPASPAPSSCGPPLRTRARGSAGPLGAEKVSSLWVSQPQFKARRGDERGVGRERARPRARSLRPPDRCGGLTSTPRGEARCIVTAQARHVGVTPPPSPP